MAAAHLAQQQQQQSMPCTCTYTSTAATVAAGCMSMCISSYLERLAAECLAVERVQLILTAVSTVWYAPSILYALQHPRTQVVL